MATTRPIAAYIAAARPQAMAALTRSFRDIDLAEDGFQDASIKALQHWARDSIPSNPTAWLIRVGRNAVIDRLRKQGRELALDDQHINGVSVHAEDQLIAALDQAELRDDMLRLLFLCCHPELSPTDQLALALKIVVGLPTDKIARAFLIKPKTMEQRITRAKARAGSVASLIEPTTRQQRQHRLLAVSSMVYLLFNEGYSASGGDQHIRSELCEEAIRLARLLLDLFPSQAELMGLLALCLLQHARQPARLVDNVLVPLSLQDRQLWRRAEIDEGRHLVQKALRKGQVGRFQVQAAIAALHCEAVDAEQTDWPQIEQLYQVLLELQPSPVVKLNHAVALAKTQGAHAALERLRPLQSQLATYLHFHSTMGGLLAEIGETDQAARAFATALSLNPTSAEADYLDKRLQGLAQPEHDGTEPE